MTVWGVIKVLQNTGIENLDTEVGYFDNEGH
jgi:hypothetical protein